jgi:hypothetical protein
MSNRRAAHISSAVMMFMFVFVVTPVFFLTDDVANAEPVIEEPIADEPVEAVEEERTLDTETYDLKLRQLAHLKDDEEPGLWPADAVYPNVDAILPFNRIVAYYGNFYSKGMGVLGQYAPDEALRRLQIEVEAWKAADPTTSVVPAIDYIAVTAQRGPGADGMYRWRMPGSQITKALGMAEKVDGVVILEVQAGLSDVLVETKALEPFLSLPNVHLAIDPEFAMKKSGSRPGTRVGTVDAAEINAIAEYLATLVNDNDLPPKVLVVHRYTKAMVTNADKIEPLPDVQIVMDMDGWGSPGAKRATYNAFQFAEPVQFTGFKLFYRNDVRYTGSRMLTPAEILKLTPSPSFIQYQ